MLNVNRTDSERPDSVVDEFLRLGLHEFLLQRGGAVAREDHDVPHVQPVPALCNIKSNLLYSLLSHILHLIGREHLNYQAGTHVSLTPPCYQLITSRNEVGSR